MEVNLDGIFVQNSTYNYDNYEYEEECKPGRGGRFEVVFIPFLYSVTLLVGLLGNGLLLFLLFQKRQNLSVMDIFALNWGVADCLLLVTLPFWSAQAAQSDGWIFGTPLCKITGAVFNINFYCGIFLLACISLDRYLSIVHATQMYCRRKPWLVQASCLLVWLLSLLLSIPDFVFLEAVKEDRQSGKMECLHNYPPASLSAPDWRLASRLLYHVVGFLLPAAILVFCYSCILLRLQRGSQKQRVSVRFTLAVIMVFFLCWMPYNISLIADTFQNKSKAPDEDGLASGSCVQPRTSLENSLVVTSALGCFHACLNPLLYFGLCQNIRKRLLDMLRGAVGAQEDSRNSLWELAIGEERLPEGQAHEKVMLNQVTSTDQQLQANTS